MKRYAVVLLCITLLGIGGCAIHTFGTLDSSVEVLGLLP